MQTTAKVLADSVGPTRCRLTTVEVCFPRIILAQVRTYGMLAYSVRSMRAVPTAVLLREVEAHPFLPARWSEAVRGMVAGEPMADGDAAQCESYWLWSRDAAVRSAQAMAALGCAKEHVNRLLEPFAWTHAVVTGTEAEWKWLLKQRCADDAQPEFQALAWAIRDAMANSVERELGVGDWHRPYATEADFAMTSHEQLFASARRCARVSYRPFDGSIGGPVQDAEGGRRLLADRHLSPFEHSAMACATPAYRAKLAGFMAHRTLLGY